MQNGSYPHRSVRDNRSARQGEGERQDLFDVPAVIMQNADSVLGSTIWNSRYYLFCRTATLKQCTKRFSEIFSWAKCPSRSWPATFAVVADGSSVARHPVVDMAGEFILQSSHLIKVCDAFLSGHLRPNDLRAIGFCLIASDAFECDAGTSDGERVTRVTNYRSSPEINFPINADNVAKWRDYLETGNDVF